MQTTLKTSQPKRQKLIDLLRSNIATGQWRPGDMIGSEVFLSKEFEVSRGTVRQALSSLEQEDLLVRIPGRGTFVREARARAAKVSNLAILVDTTAGLTNNFCLMEILEGLRTIAGELDLLESLNIKFLQYKNMDQCVSCIADNIKGADGVLAISFMPEFAEAVSKACFNGQPCINFFTPSKQSQVSQVVVDQAEGMRRAVNYLAQLGHRKIGLVVIPANASSMSRVSGYHDSLEKANIKFDHSLVVEVALGEYGVQRSMEHFLNTIPDCSAVIIGGGMLTHAVLQAVESTGRSIPDDLSVIAFDDTYETRTFTPPLSVMKQPLYGGIRTTFQKLVSMVRGMLPGDTQSVPLSPELIIRESCKALNA